MNVIKWIALCDVLVAAIFAAVAIYFGKWWIILSSLLTMGYSYKQHGGDDNGE